MFKKLHIAVLTAFLLPLTANGQSVSVDFENSNGYNSLGVYDSWENSPFRTGQLEGNVQVINNHLKNNTQGSAKNNSDKILGFQRSRFAGNIFGARINLTTPLDLTKTAKYVHVMIYREGGGRVMLVGLGKRRDWADQPAEVEQFREFTTSNVGTGGWYDAVFAVKGAGGIDVSSLVVVPDCESTHNYSDDQVVYIDNIEINENPNPRTEQLPYAVNFDPNATLTRTPQDKYTAYVGFANTTTTQKIETKQLITQKCYINRMDTTLSIKVGQSFLPLIDYNFNERDKYPWMHSYIYIDRGLDGKFDVASSPVDNNNDDLMSYSYYNGTNSVGTPISDSETGKGSAIQSPTFTIPSDWTPGFYRIRFKVDWNSVDPAGNRADDILQNAGIILDARINIHGPNVTVSRGANAEGTNGEVYDASDVALKPTSTPFGQSFTFKAKPSPGFMLSHVVIRHGYRLDGRQEVFGTKQYDETTVPGYAFVNNTYTIPAELMDGDVKIFPYFKDEVNGENYPVNFNKEQTVNTRTERKLNSFTLKGATSGNRTITVPAETPNKVYRDLTSQQASAMRGETMAVDVDYTGNSMHVYLYIDYNNDGQFDNTLNADGTPGGLKELVTYTYYHERNSVGQPIHWDPPVPMTPIPSFTIPTNLPNGKYRARLKVDWDNIDPAGDYYENTNNKIDGNGGAIIDFLLNVHNDKHIVRINTTHGSLTGAPYKTALFQPFTITTRPTASGYHISTMTIKHGHNFNGPQFIRGNKQWEEVNISPISDNTIFNIPDYLVDGDMIITGIFTDGGSDYRMVFNDEFDGPDNSAPNTGYWHTSPKGTSAWDRFISTDPRVAFVRDGNFVAHAAIHYGENEMKSGAIESSGKYSFQYGRIEARILTNKHTGNFPAFWLMPENQKQAWPKEGEIDIWEQINSEDKSYHTVHTNWTYNLKHSGNSGSKDVSMDRYHTYTLDWSPAQLIWYVDGEQAFIYNKSTNQSELDQGQWPFDRPFYIILNQSVGKGDWAANPDNNYTYETLFDWVRVYQKENETVTLKTTPNNIKNGGLRISANEVYTHFKNFSSAFDLQKPSDSNLGIFIATQIGDEEVILKKIEEEVIPANTGVILAYQGGSSKTTDKTVTFTRILGPYDTDYLNEVASKYADNKLVAVTTTKTNVPLENRRHFGYFRHNGDTELSIGFYKPNSQYTTLNAGTSYLKENTPNAAPFLPAITEEMVSSIEEVKKDETTDKTWYNLQGAKQEKPKTSGVYIQGRKKVVVK